MTAAVQQPHTPAAATVITATLLRGRVYVYKDTMFERDKPVVVDVMLAAELEDLFHEVRDSEGDINEKPLFAVAYDVVPPASEIPAGRRRRLDMAERAEREAGAPAASAEEKPRGIIRRARGSSAR